jgi:hypothetical protein
MRNQPVLTYHLPHRRAGSFGASAPGLVAEWITTTWLRFGVFLYWILVLFCTTLSPLPGLDRALVLVASPVVAFFLHGGIVLAGWIAYFVPGSGVVFGVLRLVYLRLFSRLIVQEAPEVELPLWRGRQP